MTEITKVESTSVNLRSKKARQNTLKNKIDEIDEELKNIGISNLKYRVGNIVNPETNQNTLNISTIGDTSFLIRLIAYYENMLQTKNKLKKDKFNFPDTFILKQNNSYSVYDIVQDLKLRLTILLNSARINTLTGAKAKLLPFLNEESRFVSALKDVQKMFEELDAK